MPSASAVGYLTIALLQGVQRTRDPLTHGVLAGAEHCADLGQGELAREAQHEGLARLLIERGQQTLHLRDLLTPQRDVLSSFGRTGVQLLRNGLPGHAQQRWTLAS